MSTSVHRVMAVLATLPLALGALALEGETEPVEATETLYISAGCPPDTTPGTCTSTRWLGTQTGDATSNYLTSTTPVDEVLYRANGSINWRDYPSDLSLDDNGYDLDVTRPLEIDLRVTNNAVMANNTVHARADLWLCDRDEEGALVGCSSETVTAADQTVTLLPQSSQTVEFDIDLPEEFAGRALQRLTVWVSVHGVNAQGGYIDQQGGSPVRIPHLVTPAPAA